MSWPKGVLFACNQNSIRSPMAEAIAARLFGGQVPVSSVGVHEGGPDPFIAAILAEDGFTAPDHAPQTFATISPAAYDIVIALTPEAAQAARQYFPGHSVEQWLIPNPTDERGSRDRLMMAYRDARDLLKKLIAERFGDLVP